MAVELGLQSAFSWISLPKWCRLLTPQDKPIHYPPKMKSLKHATSISRWSSLAHFHIGNLFYSDWFPGESCQFSFIFQFATASAQAHSLCWIIKRLFCWPLPCMPTGNLWSCCQIDHVIYWYDAQLWQLSDRWQAVLKGEGGLQLLFLT